MPLLSFRPRSSGLQVIAQMCPRWHRQGARAGHQRAGRPSVGQTTRSAPYGQRSRPGTAFAKLVGVGNETVHRIAREMWDAA